MYVHNFGGGSSKQINLGVVDQKNVAHHCVSEAINKIRITVRRALRVGVHVILHAVYVTPYE